MIRRINIITRSRERLEDITHRVNEAIKRSGVAEGICYLFVAHTTAGILINENDDPDMGRDILERLEALVPTRGKYHHAEGNAPAHIKASLVGQTATVPIEDGRLALGRWQGVFLAEFDGPRDRTIVVTIIPAAKLPEGEGIPEEFRRRT